MPISGTVVLNSQTGVPRVATMPNEPPSWDSTTLLVHFKSVLLLLCTDLILKGVLKLGSLLGVCDGNFSAIIQLALNYFCGVGVLVFCAVGLLTISCNGWRAVRDAIKSSKRS
jgi:hypothetical protein